MPRERLVSVGRLKARMAAFFLTEIAERKDLNPLDIRPNAADGLLYRHQGREYNIDDLVHAAIQTERANSGSTGSDDDIAAVLLVKLDDAPIPDA